MSSLSSDILRVCIRLVPPIHQHSSASRRSAVLYIIYIFIFNMIYRLRLFTSGVSASLGRPRRDVLFFPAASVVDRMRRASSLRGPSLLFSELKPRPLGGTTTAVLITQRPPLACLLGRTARLRIRLVRSELAERLAGGGRRLGGVRIGAGARTGRRHDRRRVFTRFLTHLGVA